MIYFGQDEKDKRKRPVYLTEKTKQIAGKYIQKETEFMKRLYDGISEEEARSMIVSGFANPVSKELPLEYAVEMNNLIRLEMKAQL